MSHLAVLVIGPDYEKQLAPYHEFECTGRRDEYVVEVNVTDTVRAEFERSVKAVRLADGTHLDRFDDHLYTGTPEHRFGNKTFELPAGAVELELTAEAARAVGIGCATVDDAARSYYGDDVIIRDGEYFDLTNPNKRWDWYVLGGRWTGAFLLKAKKRGLVGRPGLMTEAAPPGYADQALKGDVDLVQMRNDAGVRARFLWKDVRRITGGATWDSWSDVRATCKRSEKEHDIDIERARAMYGEQPAIKALRAHDKEHGTHKFSFDMDDNLALEEEKFVEIASAEATCWFAFVRDGQWTERGSMGWWGAVSDEISPAQWRTKFNAMLDALPDDTLLSMVDCHI